MQVFIDHLAAVLVTSVLVLIIALIQVRGVQSNAESTINHIVRSDALNIVEILEQDIMNMRTPTQTATADTLGKLAGGAGYACGQTLSSDTTTAFTFATLSDPQGAGALGNPDTAAVSIVTYRLVSIPGDSVGRTVGGVDINHPLHRIDREIGGVVTGSSQSNVVFFKVEYALNGIAGFASGVTCPGEGALKSIRYQIQVAGDGIGQVTADQSSVSQLNFSRYGATLDLINWE